LKDGWFALGPRSNSDTIPCFALVKQVAAGLGQ
jgi:hypothetical protein